MKGLIFVGTFAGSIAFFSFIIYCFTYLNRFNVSSEGKKLLHEFYYGESKEARKKLQWLFTKMHIWAILVLVCAILMVVFAGIALSLLGERLADAYNQPRYLQLMGILFEPVKALGLIICLADLASYLDILHYKKRFMKNINLDELPPDHT